MVCLKVDKILLTSHLINSTQTQIQIVFASSWLLYHLAALSGVFINSLGENNSLFYRVSIKSFPDYKQSVHLDMLELYVAPQLEEFQLWIICQQDGGPPHWGSFTCSSVFGCNISKQVDWERWSDTLATTIAGYHSP